MAFVLAILLLFAEVDSQTSSPELLSQVLSSLRLVSNTTSPKCQQQMAQYFANFSKDPKSWSLQMLDATSKIPSGIIRGHFYAPGDFKECVRIKASNATNEVILGKYCLGSMSPMVSVGYPFFTAWAFCMPNGCTAQDANIMGNDVVNKLIKTNVTFREKYCQTIHDVEEELDGAAVATISFLTLLIFGFVLVTLYELYSVVYRKKDCHPVVRGLSFYNNCQKIFKMGNHKRFSSMNGIRTLSIMYVVYFHSYQNELAKPIRNYADLVEFLDDRISMPIYASHYSVDSFFVLGAALMVFNFLKARFNNIRFNIITHYVHRYLRLTPPLAMVILVHTTLSRYMGSGPEWPLLKDNVVQNCVNYWWSPLLYIQNFVNWKTQCLAHTWYLTVEMQLFVLSPPFLFVLWKYPKFGLSLLGLATAGSMSYSFYLAWEDRSYALANTVRGILVGDRGAIYNSILARASSWIIGMILGYYLFKANQNRNKFRMNQTLLVSLWLLCLATITTCVMVGFNTLRGPEYNQWGNVLYLTFVRPSWCLAVSWIIFACSFGYGGPINWFLSLPVFEVLATLSYSIFLIHIVVLFVVSYSQKEPDEFSLSNLAYNYWGVFAYSVLLSVLLVLTMELPVATIEQILFSCSTRKVKRRNESQASGATVKVGDLEAANPNS